MEIVVKAWRAKLACTCGILVYYFVGYFTLNRMPFAKYHDVPRIPYLDDLPIVPWTLIVYNSVFLLGGLGIWLLPDARAVRRYFLSAMITYTLTYAFFALFPTRIERQPIPETGSMWLWALGGARKLDLPYTCFPSLHMANCGLVVAGLWRTRWGPWFLAWSLAIAVSTLTTDQHVFLDLPAGVLMALVGHVASGWVLGRREREDRNHGKRASRDGPVH